MRQRITTLLLGVAVLGTTFIVGQQAAVAEPSKVDEAHKAAQLYKADEVVKPVKGRTTDQERRKYILRIETRGGGDESGTDANVWLRLSGTKIPKWVFRVPSHGPLLAAGRWTEYTFEAPDLGHITNVEVWVDNSGSSPNWNLSTIEIHSPFGFGWTIRTYGGWLTPNVWNQATGSGR
jgi:hypothetical protein